MTFVGPLRGWLGTLLIVLKIDGTGFFVTLPKPMVFCFLDRALSLSLILIYLVIIRMLLNKENLGEQKKGEGKKNREGTSQGINLRKVKTEPKRNVYKYRRHSDQSGINWAVKNENWEEERIFQMPSIPEGREMAEKGFPCPIHRCPIQGPGTLWPSVIWVQGGSFQPAFLLYCVALTHV